MMKTTQDLDFKFNYVYVEVLHRYFKTSTFVKLGNKKMEYFRIINAKFLVSNPWCLSHPPFVLNECVNKENVYYLNYSSLAKIAILSNKHWVKNELIKLLGTKVLSRLLIFTRIK